MKILVIGSLACSLVNFRGDLLKTMSARGHEVVACAPGIPDEVKEWLSGFGVRCQEVIINRTGLNPVSDVKSLINLIKLLREEKPDKLLAYTVKPVLYSSLAARITGGSDMYSMITGLGYAFTNQKSVKYQLVSAIVNKLYRQALKTNKCIFFQNPDDLAEFQRRKLLPENVASKVINGSGVDLGRFAPVPLPRTLVFLLIARLIAAKGIREYIEAAAVIKRKYSDIRFRLVGWLDENPSSISKSELRGWETKGIVEYLGKLVDVRPAIASSSVYVLPSYREGIPRTVLEAMAMGRPIITTDAPGCRETVIEGYNGFLVPTKNVDALVNAMEKFIKDPTLIYKMGHASRQLAIEKYDVKKVNKVILEAMGL